MWKGRRGAFCGGARLSWVGQARERPGSRPRARSWLRATSESPEAGKLRVFFFARRAPRWPFAWGVERCFPDPGGSSGGTGWGACLTGVLSPSRLTGEMKGTLLARCVAPPRSVVYFCQNGLPALGSSTKMNPFTSFGKVSLLDILGSNHSCKVYSFWLARVSLRVGKAGASLPLSCVYSPVRFSVSENFI